MIKKVIDAVINECSLDEVDNNKFYASFLNSKGLRIATEYDNGKKWTWVLINRGLFEEWWTQNSLKELVKATIDNKHEVFQFDNLQDLSKFIISEKEINE